MSETQTTEAPVSAPTSPVDGLFPKLSRSAPANAPADNAPSSAEWYVMEGVPGTGQRPEWLSPKYKSMADQAKAQVELEKKLGHGLQKAPESYDLSKYEEIFTPEDANVHHVLSFAKEKNLGQDVVEGFMDAFANHIKSQKIDYSQEIEKLGPNGREMISTVATWANNTLSNEALETINQMGHSAKFVKFLDEIRQMQYHNQSQPPMPGGADSNFVPLTLEDIDNEMEQNWTRYQNDPKYRAELKGKRAMVVGQD